METKRESAEQPETHSSYRTYEEWKQRVKKLLKSLIISSYRTYEEWKPLFRTAKVTFNDGSYRTYEEWKL